MYVDYFEKVQINREYCVNLLYYFSHAVKEMEMKNILFFPENVSVHIYAVAMARFHELGYKLLPHPSYSTDLAHSESFLVWKNGQAKKILTV